MRKGVSKLALRRQILGFTQRDLAAAIKTTPNYLCAVEKRRAVPGNMMKGKILKVLGGQEDELFDITTGLAI